MRHGLEKKKKTKQNWVCKKSLPVCPKTMLKITDLEEVKQGLRKIFHILQIQYNSKLTMAYQDE